MNAVVDVTKLSWAPEIEQEVQRYRDETKKLRVEEDRLMEARRKSRFELERASWEVERQDHLVGLVLGQLEELEREIEQDQAGLDTLSSTSAASKTTGHHHLHDRHERQERHHRSNGSKSSSRSGSGSTKESGHHQRTSTGTREVMTAPSSSVDASPSATSVNVAVTTTTTNP